ncbi:hypothetical protein AVEN_200096-1 [Araneus ventricosus]|uniref:Uncharacterized protein n=1 Tax=Araneus ventricosus TaxID=182803 RepID=A0A4Y2JU22_ARAVE|nr:hypothetical protein AVEN_200096-1 [Araneus ventricosus]
MSSCSCDAGVRREGTGSQESSSSSAGELITENNPRVASKQGVKPCPHSGLRFFALSSSNLSFAKNRCCSRIFVEVRPHEPNFSKYWIIKSQRMD